MQGVQVSGVVGGEGVFGCTGCDQGKVARGGLGVVGVGPGEAAFGLSRALRLPLHLFVGCCGGLGRRVGGREEGVSQEGRRGGVFGHAHGAVGQGVAGDGDVGVGGAAALGGDDVRVVLGGDFVDDADEAVGPVEFFGVGVGGKEKGCAIVLDLVGVCGELGMDGGKRRRRCR